MLNGLEAAMKLGSCLESDRVKINRRVVKEGGREGGKKYIYI